MAEAQVQAPTPAPAPARQLGVKPQTMQNLIFRVSRGNPMLMEMILRYGVEYKCRVIFCRFHVYFIVTDEIVAILLQTEVAILHFVGLKAEIEYQRTTLFTRIQSSIACTREYMTVEEYNSCVSSSSIHMTAFFRQHTPSSDKYALYLRVCEFFGITPYTSLAVVNALWSLALTVQGVLL
jgi:hypothetical protein